MRIRVLLVLIVIVLVAAGCGSDSSDETTLPAQVTTSSPESGTQANGGFPGAGSPTAPDVTTTPGAPEKESTGKAGGGSSTTCIGC